jgi:hypothetical protein
MSLADELWDELWIMAKLVQELQCLDMAFEAGERGWMELKLDCLRRAAVFREEQQHPRGPRHPPVAGRGRQSPE